MLALLLALTFSPQARSELIPKVPIVYSSNVDGEIEPCGCRENPTGGINRRYNALKTKITGDFLSVDSGDLFYKSAPIPDFLLAQWNYQAEVLVDAYNSFGVEVFTPGDLDFAAGTEQLLKLKARAKFKFISSNIFTKDEKPLFDTHIILKKNGKKIGIFAVIDEKFWDTLPMPKDLHAKDHIEVAKQIVKKLKSESDIVIALTHLGFDLDKELAQKVPGIDAIFGAHSQSFLHQPEKVGDTLIFQTSFRGQHLGVYDTENHMYQLDQRFDSENGSPNPMDYLLSEAKLKIGKINLEMDEKIMREAQGKNENTEYQTFVRCVDCHQSQFDFHRKTRHFGAFSTLAKIKQESNLECLKCHTTGYQTDGGWHVVNKLVLDAAGKKMNSEKFAASLPTAKHSSFVKVSKAFINVQCENCHGPAGNHPFSGRYNKAVSTDTCLQCHTQERAPKWYKDGKPDSDLIKEKLKSVTCPASKN